MPCGARNQITAPSSRNTGATHQTRTRAERLYCSILSPSPEAIVLASAAVRPVDSPTQMAIMRNSNGTVRPIAATAASPIVAA